MISARSILIQNEITSRVVVLLQEIRKKGIIFCCSDVDLLLSKPESVKHDKLEYFKSVIKDINESPLAYLKHVYTELTKYKSYRSNILDDKTDTWRKRLSRIDQENFSFRFIRVVNRIDFPCYKMLNNYFDDLLRKAKNDDQIFKRMIKKRTIFNHTFNYPKGISSTQKEYYKQTKLKLTQGVIHFCVNIVERHSACPICLERFETLEKNRISTLVYTSCGHTICESCDEKINASRCHTCRTDNRIRSLTTVNNSICAGYCMRSLFKCGSYLLAECGHIYCNECINNMVVDSSPLLSYIHNKVNYNYGQKKFSCVSCRICNDHLTKWFRIFLEFN